MSNRIYQLHLMDLGWTGLLSDHTVFTPHPSDSSQLYPINYTISKQLPLYCHLSAFSVSITSPGLCFSAIRMLINETYADRIIKRGRKIFYALRMKPVKLFMASRFNFLCLLASSFSFALSCALQA